MKRMTLVELADAAEVTPRTVRYYIAQGLLPPPVGGGSAAAYTEAHLQHIKAIKAFQLQHLPLSEIRQRLSQEPVPANAASAPSSSALDYLDGVLGRGRSPGERLAPQAGPAAVVRSPPGPPYGSPQTTAGSRSTWDRHLLVADVELHVRRPLPRDVQRKLDKLLEYARTLFEEVP